MADISQTSVTVAQLPTDLQLSLQRLITTSDPDTGEMWKATIAAIKNLLSINQSTAYSGIATPSTNPGTPSSPVFYIASNAGTYTNFGGLTIAGSDGLVVLSWSGSAWIKQIVPITIDLSNFYTKPQLDNMIPTLVLVAAGSSKNLFDKATMFEQGKYWATSTGADSTNATWARTKKIAVQGNTSYAISGYGNQSSVAQFDAVGNFISLATKSSITGGQTFTTPANCAFLGINLTSDSTFTVKDTFQLELGNVVTSYAAYTAGTYKLQKAGADIVSTKLNGATISAEDTTSSGVPSRGTVLSLINSNALSTITEPLASKNLFDKTTMFEQGKYWIVSSGADGTNATWGRTKKLAVQPNTSYAISGYGNRSDILLFDGAGAYISGATKTNIGNGFTFTTPANCAFVGINLTSDSTFTVKDTFQIELGSVVTAYEAGGSSSQSALKSTIKVPSSSIIGNTETSGSSAVLLQVKLALTGTSYVSYLLGTKTVQENIAPFRSVSLNNSNVFDFTGTYLDNVLIHSLSDEASPYRLYGTTIGANHGYSKTRITLAGHGKTNADVGSVWSDGSKQWVIVNVEDTNNLDVSCRTDNTNFSGSSLTHVSGATHATTITGGTLTNMAMYPLIKNRQLRVLIDGVEVAQADGTYQANDSITFAESYDIMEKNSIMEWLITQVGTSSKITQYDGTAVVSVSISYVWQKGGGCTIYTDFVALQNISSFQDIMFNMNNPLTTGTTYPTRKVYVPKTLPLTFESNNYNFTNPTDISSLSMASRINFTPSVCEPAGIYPDRALWLMDGVGYALGFLPVKDADIAARRTNAPTKALQIAETKKIYMSAIDGLKTSLTKGDYFSVIAYKRYFLTSAARTAKYLIKSNVGNYLYVDWHTTGVDRFDLPTDVAGKPYTLIEKSSGVNVLSQATNSLIVEITGSNNYNYLILKF